MGDVVYVIRRYENISWKCLQLWIIQNYMNQVYLWKYLLLIPIEMWKTNSPDHPDRCRFFIGTRIRTAWV